jgi:hypothetical protein
MHQVVATITAENVTERDIRLNEATDKAMSIASKGRSGGILITRHKPEHFTVAVTNQVPYGQVRESDETRQPPPAPAAALERPLEGKMRPEPEHSRNHYASAAPAGETGWETLWEPAARHYRPVGQLPRTAFTKQPS